LLKGLEVNEINYSEYLQTYRLRLDSEYYQKHFIENEKYLTSDVQIKDLCLSNIVSIDKLSINKDFNYLEISHVKANCVDYGYVNVECKNIPDRAQYILRDDDIVVSTVRPNRNSVALIHNAKRLVGTSGFTVLRADKRKISPYYLYIFCKTKYFITKLVRENTATMYPAVSDYDILNVKIPVLSDALQKNIGINIRLSLQHIKLSKALYQQAENLLFSNVALGYFSPNTKNINIKSLKTSFLTTGRLDAEYYLPKYDEFLEKLQKHPFAQLGELVYIKKSIEPGSDAYTEQGLPFIRVSDFDQFGISKSDKYLSDSFCEENQAILPSLYPAKKTILYSKDGRIGTAYLVNEDLQAITSGAILHLNIRDSSMILPEYLTLVLNSQIVKMQAERDAGGSIILHWRVSEIEKVVIPIVSMSIQKQIADLITESFSLREESERLLTETKELVEREIS